MAYVEPGEQPVWYELEYDQPGRGHQVEPLYGQRGAAKASYEQLSNPLTGNTNVKCFECTINRTEIFND